MSNTVPLHFLTDEQLQLFDASGYLHLQSVIPEELLCRTQTAAEAWVDHIIAKWITRGLIDNDFRQFAFDRRLFEAWTVANYPPCNPMLNTEIFSEEVFDFLRAPVLHSIARDLMRTPNIRVPWIFYCRPKLPPRPPQRADQTPWTEIDVPWHQDSQYMAAGAPPLLIIWVPFVDINQQRSPLQVAPRHHHDGRYENYKQGGFCSIHPDELHKLGLPKTIEMKRGDALCMHSLLPHRSLPNQTNSVRWSFDLRFENMDTSDPAQSVDGFVCAHEDASKIEDCFATAAERYHRQHNKTLR